MKTTIEIPDDLLIEAKKRAAETRSTLKEIMERALRRELASIPRRRRAKRPFTWTTVDGDLPPDLDISSRAKMYEWFEKHDSRFSLEPYRKRSGDSNDRD